jgi:serine/threonine protein kinase
VRRRLLREGRLVARLTHLHIVRAYETLLGPRPVVVLETLPGETLARLIDDRPRRLPTVDIAHLGLCVCSEVQYLHRHGVFHLDLKPSNVVANCGLAKLLDLSIARPLGTTRGGLGTTGHMAPEQAGGGLLGPLTDVWGLGAVHFEAATGRPACDEDAAAVEACLDPAPERRPTVARLTESLSGLISAAWVCGRR